MLRILAFVFSLSLIVSCVTSGDAVTLSDAEALACPAEPSQDSCQVYTCVDLDRQCGDDSYLQQYGTHYCEKFLGLCDNTLFTQAEKKWAGAAVQCLQASTYETQQLGDDCNTIEAKGFEAHAHCFTTGAMDLDAPSFCSLGPAAWRRIRGCMDRDDRLTLLGLQQIANILLTCGEQFGKGTFDQDESVDIPDETVLGEWAKEANTLGNIWLLESQDR